LHGRDAELAATRRFLARVELGPAGLVLSGAAGMGKTSLWSDALGVARAAGTRVMSTRPAEADASLAFGGLRDLIGETAPDVLEILPVPQRRGLAVVLLLEDPGNEPVDAAVVFAAMVNVLRALGDGGPLVVGVDDVQWLDEPPERRGVVRAPTTVLRRADVLGHSVPRLQGVFFGRVARRPSFWLASRAITGIRRSQQILV
jgi:hypothetical protein